MSKDKEKTNIIGETEETLRTRVQSWGFSAFHGSQIFNWVYRKYSKSFEEMTDLPKNLREKLEKQFFIGYPRVIQTIEAKKKDAKKYSFLLEKNTAIESVVLSGDGERTSFCISSQAGCAVKCLYCATGRMGFIRNLTSGEIVGQVLTLMENHGKPSSVLFMGMGEPLFNFESVVSALRLLSGIGIGVRRLSSRHAGLQHGSTTSPGQTSIQGLRYPSAPQLRKRDGRSSPLQKATLCKILKMLLYSTEKILEKE